MFGIKKKNTGYEPVIYNFDNQPVLNRDTGEFLMDFDADQKKLLRQLIDWKIPVGAFAYKGLPVEYIYKIYLVLQPYDIGNGTYSYTRIDENMLYRIVHTDLDIDQFGDCLAGAIYGIDMCSEIKNISSYPHEVLSLVADAASCGVDLCKKLSPNMDIYTLEAAVKRAYQKEKDKRKRGNIRDSILRGLLH